MQIVCGTVTWPWVADALLPRQTQPLRPYEAARLVNLAEDQELFLSEASTPKNSRARVHDTSLRRRLAEETTKR